ncbi:hypothetical protein [Hymenobacter properus]|uniref:Uncharacterized protein n=1 Tax=Hymenobacter properus TaxID=2791026 RepID=A0A931BEL1_9BACT|nr:hypothetical protein [Hymenobacter properus]MBF9140867.1 hypothetical protein [Hymenobacter properus]MBR7719676.1 hypothetical protein [Microvirga sp. SRT04]
MKFLSGWLGALAGIVVAGIVLGIMVLVTKTDAPSRPLYFVAALAAFVLFAFVGAKNTRRS